MKARKKPVTVECYEYNEYNANALAEWCNGKICGMELAPRDRYMLIPTLEGEMRADYGDIIINGVDGEFYPCKAKIFNATYEVIM